MLEHDKSLVKSSTALARFDPKARKELVVRGLNALTEVRDADFYFFKGEEHRMREELKLAISYYEKALHIDSEHEDALFWMGYCYLRDIRIGDDIELDDAIRYKRAVSAFQKLIDIRDKKGDWWGNFAPYFNLGLAQYYLCLYEEAIESFEWAIELNPEDANSYYMLGLAQYDLSLYEEAIESSEQAIELNPENADSYYMLSLSQEKLGIDHLALENLETYLLLVDYELPENQQSITYAEKMKELLTASVGYDFLKNGQYQEAIECYEKTIELNPDYTDVYYNLALAQDTLGLHNSALDNFKIYLRLENHELPENQQCITYAKERVEEQKQTSLEEKLKESDFFDIKVLDCLVFPKKGVKILGKIGLSPETASAIIRFLPTTVVPAVPKEKAKEIYEKLKEGFKIDIVPSRLSKNATNK